MEPFSPSSMVALCSSDESVSYDDDDEEEDEEDEEEEDEDDPYEQDTIDDVEDSDEDFVVPSLASYNEANLLADYGFVYGPTGAASKPPTSTPTSNPPADSAADGGTDTSIEIEVPVIFHFLREVYMQKSTVNMWVYLMKSDIEEQILPEVNRIWKQANIVFLPLNIESDNQSLTAQQKQDAAIIEFSNGRDEPDRQPAIKRLVKGFEIEDKRGINVYFIPFMGSTNQGITQEMTSTHPFITCGCWTDKPSHGKRPPVKTLMVEPEPFVVGSLGRTIAHELGHALSLLHPTTSSTPRLMGGPISGYGLTKEEITQARNRANFLLKSF